jgi:hypothetical protein
MAYVYVLNSGSSHLFEIGRPRGDVDARIKKLATENPRTRTRCGVIETEHDSLCESYLHNGRKTKRRSGEFFGRHMSIGLR